MTAKIMGTYYPDASKLFIDGEEITGFVEGVFFKKISKHAYQFTILPIEGTSFEYLFNKAKESVEVDVEFTPGLMEYDFAREALSVKGKFVLGEGTFAVGTSFPTCTFTLVKKFTGFN